MTRFGFFLAMLAILFSCSPETPQAEAHGIGGLRGGVGRVGIGRAVNRAAFRRGGLNRGFVGAGLRGRNVGNFLAARTLARGIGFNRGLVYGNNALFLRGRGLAGYGNAVILRGARFGSLAPVTTTTTTQTTELRTFTRQRLIYP
jgi:hypothetical protein